MLKDRELSSQENSHQTRDSRASGGRFFFPVVSDGAASDLVAARVRGVPTSLPREVPAHPDCLL
jgi:hypothetical protein